MMTAEQYVEAMRQAALLSEADELTRGIRHLTVTGEHETADDRALIQQLTEAAQRGHANAHLMMCCQGNDYVTFYIEPAGRQQAPGAADVFVDQLAALAEDLNPGCWRISRSPHYPF